MRALRVFVRAGAGNVFATRDQIDLGDLRWGVGGGAMLPSRVGPLAVEIGVRDSGRLLVTLWLGLELAVALARSGLTDAEPDRGR